MKLSIITVNLNDATGLRKTIESVVDQTFTDYEYIIIDGGSTDGSIDVIMEYAENVTNWVSEPDNGIYNAMNKGIKKAVGEYCFFLNSGDYIYLNDTLEKVFRDNDGNDILYGDVLISFPSGEIRTKKHPDNLSFSYFFVGTICHQAAFIKRQLFKDHGLYNEAYKIVSDWEFFIKTIVFSNAKTRHFDHPIAVHNIAGFGNQNPELYLKEREKILADLFPRLVINDYEFYKRNYSDIQALVKIKSFKPSYFIFKVIRRIISLISK